MMLPTFIFFLKGDSQLNTGIRLNISLRQKAEILV